VRLGNAAVSQLPVAEGETTNVEPATEGGIVPELGQLTMVRKVVI